MTKSQIFTKYFRKKFLIAIGVGIFLTCFRYYKVHDTSPYLLIGFDLFLLIVAFVNGLIDYRFYVKTVPKTILKLLDKSPLKEFQQNGFMKEDESIVVGYINNYYINLSPKTNMQNENSLVVLIPIQPKNGLEGYFHQFDENFRLTFSGEIVFAEAVLERYDKKYDFNKLFELIDKTTQILQDRNIESIKIKDE